MIFEVYLTDSCNRSCPFCSFAKNSFIETHDNIVKFCREIEQRNPDRFQINLFGGEPLVNSKEVKYIIDFFRENDNCKIWLFTNGDLFNEISDRRYLDRIHAQISVYDIFTKLDKYRLWLDNLNNDRIRFTYTFTQDDIDNYKKYIDICQKINIEYRIALSYDINSWSRLSNDIVYLKARLAYEIEMLRSIEKKKISYTLKPKIQRYIYYIYNNIYNNIKQNINSNKYYYCITNKYKEIFYNGKFINNNCIFNPKIPDKLNDICLNCKYNSICNKSCLMQYKNGRLPEKLCLIQKAEFDVISKYIQNIF